MIRRSKHYKAPDPAQPKSLIWPAEPTYNNPIIDVKGKDGEVSFNFILQNVDKCNLSIGVYDLSEMMFDPDEVKKAVLWWR